MFTGIVQATGQVVSVGDGVLVVDASSLASEGFTIGESIAVNGCCLTVVPGEDDSTGAVRFDLSPETLRRTSLLHAKPGSLVNLERAMSASGMLGGHVVQGHVDAVGTILSTTPIDNAVIVRIQAPKEYDRYLIDKGSVTVDGISLTVVEPTDAAFDTWIIPHTMAVTNLHQRQPGDHVNLEFDVLAKYVEKLLESRLASIPVNALNLDKTLVHRLIAS